MKATTITRAVSFLFLCFLPAACGHGTYSGSGRQEARHIILVIGDGMTIENEIAASRYLYGTACGLSFHKLPYRADVATWDVTSYNAWANRRGRPVYDPKAIRPVLGYDPDRGGKRPFPLDPETPGARDYHTFTATDSAAAATAWATGCKTDAGNIAWRQGDPEGGALKTIAELLREKQGFAIGVVSTVPFSHATPAAHVSHNKDRYDYHAIASEILTMTKPEVVIGGGHPGTEAPLDFDFISQTDYTNFKNGVHAAGYVFAERKEGIDGGVALLQAARQAADQGKKLFGLFGKKQAGHFDSPQPHDLPGTPLVTSTTRENPTFAEAVLAALKVLSRDPDGFFLMAEQGDIDWANHANDFRRMVGTVKDLHDGVQVIIDFVNRPGDDLEWTNTLLIVTADHSNGYMRNLVELRAGELPYQVWVDKNGNARVDDAEYDYPCGEVSYGTSGHTNELVRIYALGTGIGRFRKYEGQWYPGTRILDNTQMFHMMMAAAGQPVSSPLGIQ